MQDTKYYKLYKDLQKLTDWFDENDIDCPVRIKYNELEEVFINADWWYKCINNEIPVFVKRMKDVLNEEDLFYIRFIEYQYRHIYPLLAMRSSDNRVAQLEEMKEFIVDCICEEICKTNYFGFDEQLQPLFEMIVEAIKLHFAVMRF